MRLLTGGAGLRDERELSASGSEVPRWFGRWAGASLSAQRLGAWAMLRNRILMEHGLGVL